MSWSERSFRLSLLKGRGDHAAAEAKEYALAYGPERNRRSLCLEAVDKARPLPVRLSGNGASGF